MTEDDQFAHLAPAYALGALEPAEAGDFEAHLARGCENCDAEVMAQNSLLGTLPLGDSAATPDPRVRHQLLDLTAAPRLPIEVAEYEWDEVVPGVRMHVVSEDPSRGVRSCLVWADAGAQHPQHRHLGDEVILVLEGTLSDHRGQYGVGQICRSRTGSVHTEVAGDRGRCICFVVYYGELEMIG